VSYKIAYKTSSYFTLHVNSLEDDRYNFDVTKGNASQRSFSSTTLSAKVGSINAADHTRKRGMVLPFTPLSITFDEIGYAVDMPQVKELASNFKGTFKWIIPLSNHQLEMQ